MPAYRIILPSARFSTGWLTKGLARWLGAKEVTVNLVQPGSIDTDMNPAHGPFGDTLRQLTASGRYGAVEDIANAVAYLATAKALMDDPVPRPSAAANVGSLALNRSARRTPQEGRIAKLSQRTGQARRWTAPRAW